MTKEELFPKEKYPLRARMAVDIDINQTKHTVEAYYQAPTLPDLDGSDQDIGIYQSIVSYDGMLKITNAFLYHAENDEETEDTEETIYLEKDGRFVEVEDEEINGIWDEFAKKLKEHYGTAPSSPEMVNEAIEKMFTARWESF